MPLLVPERANAPSAAAATAYGVVPAAGWHRGLSVLAAVSLFLGLGPLQAQTAVADPAQGALLTVAYGTVLGLALGAFAVRTRWGLGVVDLGVLLVGAVRAVCSFAGSLGGRWYGTDEGVLVHQAALLLAHGSAPGSVYSAAWPHLVSAPGVGATPLMGGGYADTYGYPPLGAVLTAVALPFSHGLPAVALVAFGCELLAAAAMFALLPASWRPAVALLFFGLDFAGGYARQGYVTVMALPLLVVAVAGWASTGKGGALGRRGLLRAAALGLAAATQQSTWFLAPFLVLGIYLARRGDEEKPGQAARLTARYTAVAAGTWLLVNLPFAVTGGGPMRWLAGIATPLTQGAVPKGVGLIGIAAYLRGGSGTLDWYGYAAALLLLALLAALALFPRRLGPAAVLLPWLPFYLATRSTENYFTLLAPLWVTGLATAGPVAFARARGLRPRRFRDAPRAVRAAVPVLLCVPALVCAGIAAFGSAPLALRVAAVDGVSARGPHRLVVQVANRSDRPVRPHFGVSDGTVLGAYWRVAAGPRALAPGASARYVLTAPRSHAGLSGSGAPVWLRAVSDGPMTLSSVRLPAPHHPTSR